MRLADMTVETPVMVSEELAGKINAATALAQEIVDLVSIDNTVEQTLTAIGVVLGQIATDITTLQSMFLQMEHAAVASFANKHGKQVQEN